MYQSIKILIEILCSFLLSIIRFVFSVSQIQILWHKNFSHLIKSLNLENGKTYHKFLCSPTKHPRYDKNLHVTWKHVYDAWQSYAIHQECLRVNIWQSLENFQFLKLAET